MKKTRLLLVLVFLCATTAPIADTVAAKTADGGDPCCLTNPRFTGECKVYPGEGETCTGILAYLNNQASAGKTYCGNTTIRGGWAIVDCQ